MNWRRWHRGSASSRSVWWTPGERYLESGPCIAIDWTVQQWMAQPYGGTVANVKRKRVPGGGSSYSKTTRTNIFKIINILYGWVSNTEQLSTYHAVQPWKIMKQTILVSIYQNGHQWEGWGQQPPASDNLAYMQQKMCTVVTKDKNVQQT